MAAVVECTVPAEWCRLVWSGFGCGGGGEMTWSVEHGYGVWNSFDCDRIRFLYPPFGPLPLICDPCVGFFVVLFVLDVSWARGSLVGGWGGGGALVVVAGP